MNREEQITLEHLKRLYGEDVVPAPKHKDPPDIVVSSDIAVEARRLNQQFFHQGMSERLEKVSFPLEDAFSEVLKSFDSLYAGKSYWVFIDYKRPLSSEIRQAKQDMRLALKEFLDSKASNFPYEISINSEITFSIYDSNSSNGTLFFVAGSGDFDAGGWVIGVYAENIRHCINEKSSKISKHLSEYREWWLYLVDCMGLGLSQIEILEVVREVGDTGNFDKVVILNYDGQSVLATISK